MQGQDEGLGVVEAEVVALRVGEGVEPVDARGHPGDEQGAEEEEGHARVQPGFRVGFAERRVAGQCAHAEEVWPGGGVAVVLLLLLLLLVLLVLGVSLADFYVHGVGVEAAVCFGVYAGDCHFGVVVVLVVVVGG